MTNMEVVDIAPEYATYDMLDDHRLAALLARESHRLEIRDAGSTTRSYENRTELFYPDSSRE